MSTSIDLEPPPAPVPSAATLTHPPQPTEHVPALPAGAPQNKPETSSLILANDRLVSLAPLQVARLSSKARLPTRGTELSAGYDLYAAKETVLKVGERKIVPTDIAIATPPGTYGRVAPRSGLSVKKGLNTGAGVIDHDYRGAVGVLLFNQGEEEVVVEEGERCAQLILERYVGADVIDVTVKGEKPDGVEQDMSRAKGLVETARGAGGFGSTGTL